MFTVYRIKDKSGRVIMDGVFSIKGCFDCIRDIGGKTDLIIECYDWDSGEEKCPVE